MNGETGVVSVTDEIVARGEHDVRIYFHIDVGCHVWKDGESQVWIKTGETAVVLDVDPELTVKILPAEEGSCVGWVSRAYHQKGRGSTIVAAGRFKGSRSIRCSIRSEGLR